jgi:hypothetical protein
MHVIVGPLENLFFMVKLSGDGDEISPDFGHNNIEGTQFVSTINFLTINRKSGKMIGKFFSK